MSRSRAASMGDGSRSVTTRSCHSHAVPAQLALGVGQLARVLDEEAGLADELARLLGEHLEGAVAPVVDVDGVLVLVVLFLLDDHALLEDHVKAGFDVVAILLVVLIILVFVLAGPRGDRRRLFGGLFVVGLLGLGVVVIILIELLVEVLDVIFLEVFRILGFLVELVVEVFVSHVLSFVLRWVRSAWWSTGASGSGRAPLDRRENDRTAPRIPNGIDNSGSLPTQVRLIPPSAAADPRMGPPPAAQWPLVPSAWARASTAAVVYLAAEPPWRSSTSRRPFRPAGRPILDEAHPRSKGHNRSLNREFARPGWSAGQKKPSFDPGPPSGLLSATARQAGGAARPAARRPAARARCARSPRGRRRPSARPGPGGRPVRRSAGASAGRPCGTRGDRTARSAARACEPPPGR